MTAAIKLQHFLAALRAGKDLTESETGEVFLALQDVDLDESLIISLLTAWKDKGATVDEIYALARVMRDRVKKISSRHPLLIDTAGTGASKIKTFNISTAAAFVIAGAGIPVAKHGNRAATSSSGSADVISELGVKIDIPPERAAKCLDDIGICFMFAPFFHSLSPTLGKVRRNIGFPTIFNIVGPLCNPAMAPHQIMGVWSKSLLQPISEVMARLGNARSWVIHGSDGLDEITLNGKTLIAEVADDRIDYRSISPADFGIDESAINGLPKVTPAESASLVRTILNGECENIIATNLVLLNAAAAIYVAGKASDLKTAYSTASESLKSGRAKSKLDELARETNR